MLESGGSRGGDPSVLWSDACLEVRPLVVWEEKKGIVQKVLFNIRVLLLLLLLLMLLLMFLLFVFPNRPRLSRPTSKWRN